MKIAKIIMSSIASASACLTTTNTFAAEVDNESRAFVLEEVIVTAEKVETNLQSTAASVVALLGKQIEAEGRNDIRDVLSSVGGVSFSGGGQGAVYLNIRGVEGSTAGLPGRTDSGASLYSDGIVLSDLLGSASSAAFFDVARVEVLRGPQGTLYGRGAEAGTVNVVTNNPGKEFDLAGTIELGNYHLQHLGGMINVPLGNSWALRAAYNSVQRNGYYTSGLDAADTSASRVKLRYDAGGSFTALFGAEIITAGGPLGAGVASTGIPSWGLGDPPTDAWDDVTKNGGVTGVVPGSTQDNKLVKFWSQLDLTTNVGNLSVVPGYSKARNDARLVAIASATVPNQFVQRSNLTDGEAKSIEARLSSPDGSPFRWMVGAYYDSASAFYFNGNFTRNVWQDQSTMAGFAQANVSLGDKWALIGGLRQTKDEKSYITERTTGALNHSDGKMSWSRTDWKLGVENHLTADSMLYLTVATGYRPGGADNGSSETLVSLSGQTIPNGFKFSKPEFLTSYEIGTKNELFGNKLRLNADVYYHQFKDPQYSYFTNTAVLTANCPNGAAPTTSIFSPPGQGSCSSLANGAAVKAMGAELDATWLLTPYDRIGLSASYLSSKVAEHQVIQLSIPAGSTVPAGYTQIGANIEVDTKGATTPRSPKSQANGYYQHSFDFTAGSLSVRGDVRYLGESNINGFNYLNPVVRSGVREGDLYVVSSSVRYDAAINYEPRGGKWNLNLYGRNLTNEAVKSFITGVNTTVEAPRTVGIVLTAKL